jgi:hypothetical protein
MDMDDLGEEGVGYEEERKEGVCIEEQQSY